MNIIERVEYANIFHVIEEVVEDTSTSNKEITPKPFNALVVNALTWDNATTIRTPFRMAQHVVPNIIVFYSAVTADP